jgi:hypothetical protein
LAINQTRDIHEEQADRMADTVMRMPDPNAWPPTSNRISSTLSAPAHTEVLRRQPANLSNEEKSGRVETLIRKNWKKYMDEAKLKFPLKDRITWYETDMDLVLAKRAVADNLARDHLRRATPKEKKELYDRYKNLAGFDEPPFEKVEPYIIGALGGALFIDLVGEKIPAFYDPTTGKIHIRGEEVGLIAHEALHSYSSPEFKEVFGRDMDEGMTEYLSEEIERDYMGAFAKEGGTKLVLSAYGEQANSIRQLVDSGAIKKDDLLNAYFKGGKELLSKLKKAKDKAEKAKTKPVDSEAVPPQLPEKKSLETSPLERPLQRVAATPHAHSESAPPLVHEVLHSASQPMDAATRGFMETRFGINFCGVRIHTDAKASESARSVNALAYTVGRDVVFAAQQYQPATAVGRRLLAHELTHVAQQQDGGQPQLQRTCDPKALKRPDFLAATGYAAPDAPLGLTRLNLGDVKFPAVIVQQATTKKGSKPKWTLAESGEPALPDPIPSFYTTGIFEEATKDAIIVPDGVCAGKYHKATYWVVGKAADLVKQGELEHCADYQYAFDMSLVKWAAAVNELAGKDLCGDTQDKCETYFKHKLEKKTGVAPDDWPSVFTCLVEKSELVRDKRKHLHDPVSRNEINKDLADCKVRIITTDLPGLGTAPSDIIKCPEMGFTSPAPKTPPATKGSSKPATKPDVGEK